MEYVGVEFARSGGQVSGYFGAGGHSLALVAIGGTLATVPVRRSVGVAAYMSVLS